MYIDELHNIDNKYDNTSHSTIKMKIADGKSGIYIDFDKKNKDYPKFKFDDQVRISKYTNIFRKTYIPNCSEGVFVIKKVKNTVLFL